MHAIKLVKPSGNYKNSFIESIKEFQSENRFMNLNTKELSENFGDFLSKIGNKEKGNPLPVGTVRTSTRWLVDGNEYIGGVSILHELSGAQSHTEGHISYGIRPSKRMMGYGSKALELALPIARKIGISEVLIVCDDENTGSRKIIESNGGILKDKIEVDGGTRRRYLVRLSKNTKKISSLR